MSDADDLRYKVAKLEQERDAAVAHNAILLKRWRDEIVKTGDLRYALHVMLTSASPDEHDDPTMYAAWQVGIAALNKAQEDL